MGLLQLLTLLICPLMMLFCMKGMFGHNKHHHSYTSKDLDDRVKSLELENGKLRKEIDTLSTIERKES